MKHLLRRLQTDFPQLSFKAGDQSCWSPQTNQIIYTVESSDDIEGGWALLHEVGHALLGHKTYASDFELLRLEVAAWDSAQQVATKYGHHIDDDHIQDCLDTYRDWLHRRCTCPTCGNKSLQENPRQYSCFNCGTKWQVSASLFCRPYRMLKHANPKPEALNTKQIPSLQ